jgi:hypothetical protein
MNETQAIEIKTLAARGIIADAVSRLSNLLASRTSTEAEEVRLQDLFLQHTKEYVQAVSGAGAMEFMVPTPTAIHRPHSTAIARPTGQQTGPVDLDYQKQLQDSLAEITDQIKAA